MKNILFACLVLSATLATAQDYHVDPLPAPIFRGIFKDKDVTLKAGTLIIMETSDKINSDAVTVGQSVQFKVRSNVMADGKVAVRTGALATGRVKSLKSSSYNDPEEIRIELLYVQAVDGQMLPLNGNEQTIRGQFSGQSTEVNSGTAITAQVTNTVEVKID